MFKKILFLTIAFCFSPFLLNAAGIDSTDQYAWGEDIAWLNFGISGANVDVSDTELTGYIWSETKGWISLNCSNTSSCFDSDFKVSNDGAGNLSGYAWGENIGWIDFSAVTIDADGYFLGYATGDISGDISFNCLNTNSCASSDFKVRTDWRPIEPEAAASSSFTPKPMLPALESKSLETEDLDNVVLEVSDGEEIDEFNDLLIDIPEKTLEEDPLSNYVFTRNLSIGDSGEDVLELQKFLNSNGFLLVDSGPGSLGNETDFFGSLTKIALINFQNYYKDKILIPLGLTEGTGYFGDSTRAFINNSYQDIPEIEILDNELLYITKDLYIGMQDSEVGILQTLLASDESLYPEALITNYFGLLTEAAVIRFQTLYDIKCNDESYCGYVGPKTRVKLLEVFY